MALPRYCQKFKDKGQCGYIHVFNSTNVIANKDNCRENHLYLGVLSLFCIYMIPWILQQYYFDDFSPV